jgi:hypothetical protein
VRDNYSPYDLLTWVRYNSVIFSTTSAYNYAAGIVSENFLTGGAFNGVSDSLQSYLEGLQQSAKNNTLHNMTTTDCISNFSQNYVSNYAGVLLVSDLVTSNNSLLWSQIHDSSNTQLSDNVWMCFDQAGNKPCDYSSLKDPWRVFSSQGVVTIKYCLADPATPQCTVELLSQLLYTVILCNFVKIGVFVYLIFFKFEPIITIGDAIASFLDEPDPTTAGLGSISAQDVRGKWYSKDGFECWAELGQDHIWKPGSRRYFKAASTSRWVMTLLG